MPGWDEMLTAHARGLAAEAHGAETVTWQPKDGEERTFLAHVMRQGITTQGPGADRAWRRRATVILPRENSEGEGGVDQVNPGDRVLLVLELGQPAVSAKVTSISFSDAAGWHVEVTG